MVLELDTYRPGFLATLPFKKKKDFWLPFPVPFSFLEIIGYRRNSRTNQLIKAQYDAAVCLHHSIKFFVFLKKVCRSTAYHLRRESKFNTGFYYTHPNFSRS